MKNIVKMLAGLCILFLAGIAMADGEVSTEETTYSSSPGFKRYKANGHFQHKGAILDGDIINSLQGFGYNGSGFTTSPGVGLYLKASQDWTSTANGTKFTIETTPDDSTTAAEVFSVDADGNVSVAGNLAVTGTTGGTGATTLSSATITNLLLIGETSAISTFTPTALTLDDGVTLTVTKDATIEDATIDDLNAHETFYVGEGSAISTFTPTALTLDDGLTFTANGVTALVGDVGITGATPSLTIGDGGEEDAQLNINGNATDGYLGVDDTDDVVKIGTGSVVGVGTAIEIDDSADVTMPNDVSMGTTTADIIKSNGLFQLPAAADIDDAITPTAVGQLIYNSADNEVCFSTATNSGAWVSMSDGASACSH